MYRNKQKCLFFLRDLFTLDSSEIKSFYLLLHINYTPVYISPRGVENYTE